MFSTITYSNIYIFTCVCKSIGHIHTHVCVCGGGVILYAGTYTENGCNSIRCGARRSDVVVRIVRPENTCENRKTIFGRILDNRVGSPITSKTTHSDRCRRLLLAVPPSFRRLPERPNSIRNSSKTLVVGLDFQHKTRCMCFTRPFSVGFSSRFLSLKCSSP